MTQEKQNTRYYLINLHGLATNKYYRIERYVDGVELGSSKIGGGIAVLPESPAERKIMIDKDGGATLCSHIGSSSMFVVSSELKSSIEQCCTDIPVEYIDFQLIDRKGTLKSSDYWIINPLGTFDCLALSLCEPYYDDDQSGKVDSVEQLVLDANKMSAAPSMFRIREESEAIILREDVAMALKGKFTNLQLCELSFDTNERIIPVDFVMGRSQIPGEPWNPSEAWAKW